MGLNNIIVALVALTVAAFMFTCGSAEENKNKFFGKGTALYEKGDYAGARPEFKHVLQIDPKFALGHHMLGMTAMKMEAFSEAFGHFSTAVKFSPDNIDAQIQLARLLIAGGQPEKAEKKITLVLSMDPGNGKALLLLSSLHVGRGEAKEALGILKGLMARGSTDPELFLLIASLYRMQGRPADVDEAMKRGIELNPGSPRLLTAQVKYYTETGRLKEGEGVLTSMMEIWPGSPAVVSNFVRLYTVGEQYEKAKALCREQLRNAPDDAFFHHLMAGVHIAQKHYAGAEEDLNRAIALRPGWSVPCSTLGKVCMIQGKKAEAIERFEAAVAKDPKNVTAYLFLGALFEKDGAYGKAVDVYERTLAKVPDNWAAANNLAFLASEFPGEEEDLERALSLSLHALKLKPSESEILDTLGWLYYKLGNFDRARDTLESAAAKAPESPAINYHLGMVHYKTGSVAQAKERIARALAAGEHFIGKEDAERIIGRL